MSDSLTIEEVGEEFGSNDRFYSEWACGIFANDGCLYVIPFCGTRVLKFDPQTNESNTIGSNLSELRYKWHGSVLCSKHNTIYTVPYASRKVLKVNPNDETTVLIGKDFGNEIMKYMSACYHDGYVYAMPCNAKEILRINTTTDETTTIEGLNLEDYKYSGTVLGDDLCIYGVPYKPGNPVVRYDPKADTSILIDIEGGVIEGCSLCLKVPHDGSIWTIPNDDSEILVIDLPKRTATKVNPDNMYMGGQLSGGTVGEDGNIYILPSGEGQVKRIEPKERKCTKVDRQELSDKFYSGCALGHDGFIYCIPSVRGRLLRIETKANMDHIQIILNQKLWHNAIRLLKDATTHDKNQEQLRWKNKNDDNALFYAIKNNAPLEVIERIVETNYLVLHDLDTATNLLPFLLAATVPDSKLAIVYNLLRFHPGLLHEIL